MIKKLPQTNSSFIRIGLTIMICSTVMMIRIDNVHAATMIQAQITAKDIIVKGTVRDKSSPLPGVTITLKGNAKTGVASDVNGNFSLQVPENGILIF